MSSKQPSYRVELLLYNIRSVYNTAAIFRTAECLGVSKIWLSGYTPAPIDRFGRPRNGFHKVALGTEREIEWEEMSKVEELIKLKKAENFQVIGLEQSSKSVPLKSFKSSQNILLIPGTETIGLDKDVQGMCEILVEIEQVGNKESLNVHSATSIALWKLLL